MTNITLSKFRKYDITLCNLSKANDNSICTKFEAYACKMTSIDPKKAFLDFFDDTCRFIDEIDLSITHACNADHGNWNKPIIFQESWSMAD